MVKSLNEENIPLVSTLSIKPGDVLIVKIDQETFDMVEAQSYCKVVKELFPKNDILITFNGINFGVIKKEDYNEKRTDEEYFKSLLKNRKS